MARDDDRLHTLDILRGFALFGMVWVHFHQKMRLEVSGWQDLIGWFVYIFVEQKAWGTFAFLFGVGFAVPLRRLDARGAPVVAVYLRRMAALAVIGILMDVFFGFQVLVTCACGGVVLLFVRRWSSRALLALAILSAMARPIAAAALSVAARWHVLTAPLSWRSLLPDVNLALFIIGLLAVRHDIFDAPLKHVRTIRGWMIFGVVSWALSWAVVIHLPDPSIPGFRFGYTAMRRDRRALIRLRRWTASAAADIHRVCVRPVRHPGRVLGDVAVALSLRPAGMDLANGHLLAVGSVTSARPSVSSTFRIT